MSAHDPDLMRRIALERKDAEKQALERVIKRFDNYAVESASYRAAKRLFTRLVKEEMAEI